MGLTVELTSNHCIQLENREKPVLHYSNDGYIGENLKDNTDFQTGQEKDKIDPVQHNENTSLREETALSWVVCFAGFMIYFTVLGIQTSFGLVFDQFLIDFKRSHSETAWIGSIANWGLVFFAGIANFFCQQIGPGSVTIIGSLISAVGILASSFVTTFEFFYLTYSLAFGFGSSLAYTTVVLAISDYFTKRRALALGIATAGSSSGTMVMNTVLHYLFQTYGWRISFRVNSILCLVMVPCGLAMKYGKRASRKRSGFKSNKCNSNNNEITERGLEPKKQHTDSGPNLTTMEKAKEIIASLIFDVRLLKCKLILIWLFTMVFTNFGYYIPHTYLILYSKSIGVSPAKASRLFVFFGVFSTIGRVFWGSFSQLSFVNTKILMHVCIFSMGTMNFFVTSGSEYYYLASFMSIYGFLDGCFCTMLPIITLDVASPKQQKSIWGTVLFFQSFSLLLGPPVAGWVFQHVQSYKFVFYINGFPLVTASLFLIAIALLEKKKLKNSVIPFMGSSSSKVEFGQSDWTMEYKVPVPNDEVFKSMNDSKEDDTNKDGDVVEKHDGANDELCKPTKHVVELSNQYQTTSIPPSCIYEKSLPNAAL